MPWLRTEEIIYAVCPSSCLSPESGVRGKVSVKLHFSLTVVLSFVCLAIWWLGPFDQCVEDFCSVPRGGVKKIGRGTIKKCIEDFYSVPRGGVKKKSVEDR